MELDPDGHMFKRDFNGFNNKELRNKYDNQMEK